MGAEASERRYHRAPCGLLTVRVDDEIVDANETFGDWIGRRSEDLIGTGFSSLLDPSSRLFYETRHLQTLHVSGQVSEVALAMLLPDGTKLPVLINASLDAAASLDGTDGGRIIRVAVFPAADRIAYERDLLRARRDAEKSEARVRILQKVSRDFGSSANDQEVADAFVAAAREAFTAVEAAVHLFGDHGEPRLVAGTNPLADLVDPAHALWNTTEELVLSVDDLEPDFPRIAAQLRDARREAISILPLLDDGERLGVLVCCFARTRDFGPEFLELQEALGRQASQTLVRVRLQRELEFLALHDPLTRLPNRQLVEQSLRDAIRNAAKAQRALTVVFLDLDDFKIINDTLGHSAGDEVLCVVAERLRHAVRGGDIVGRLGGDEFVAVCADAGPSTARSIAERLRAETGQSVAIGQTTLEVSVSVGLAVYDPAVDPLPTPDQLLIRADGAMYSSKESGKNRISMEKRAQAPLL
jgi:diguanylate cyclase (GGDEF)-like protein